jgi:hypothetical protein
MPLSVLKAVSLGALVATFLLPQGESANGGKRPKILEKPKYGSFTAKGEGAGFVLFKGDVFIEAIVIHGEMVESGVFQLDTGLSTGCVLETYFADKMKVMGLGNVTLKLGDLELKNVKATVLDHPKLQKIFKEQTGLFQNRPICGVIGCPVLTANRTLLDFENFCIRFLPPLKEEERAQALKTVDHVLSYRDDQRTLWLEMKVNEKVDGVFLVKTGQPYTCVSKEFAEKAGLRKGKSPRSFKAGEVELAPLVLDLRVFKDLPAHPTVSFPVAGVLGNDFLFHFKTIIDPKSKELALSRKKL